MPDLQPWFATHTHAASAPLGDLVAAKRGRRVGVVLPARDEATTIGEIVRRVRTAWCDLVPLVDEVVVVDSRSSDDTAAAAREAGAVVVTAEDPDPAFDGGKGSAMRTGMAHLTSDVGVFLDADVRGFDPAFVARLVGPLLTDPSLVLVKAFYDRPTHDGGGGRVTELAARPEITRRAPELAGFVQPLAGECAFVLDAFVDLPVVSGYGVDVGMLLQAVRKHGLDATAQADLGRREHDHQGLRALGRMALQVRAAFDLVLDDRDVVVDERWVPGRDADGAATLVAERVETRLLPPPGAGATSSTS
ncbi:glucosyl-3-phosphoglycerate synthase [Aeromicrobium sp. Leaf289]|uniref:glucosyl-3-phosphoglycerate synthase n=1 Tax=Aeromicrobium sp. Leaf289 TaxID=1736324 RepID=UPI000AB917E8|nr:glucosyl-3-phosphoglycerate synthase [Aeromicrobium sp. Leaf289]